MGPEILKLPLPSHIPRVINRLLTLDQSDRHPRRERSFRPFRRYGVDGASWLVDRATVLSPYITDRAQRYSSSRSPPTHMRLQALACSSINAQWPKVCADPDATDGTPQLALSARISSTPMVGYREGWGGHELSLQPPVWRFTLIFTRPVPRPRVPFGRSRRVKPLKWSVLRSTVDSGAHLRRFGYPQQKS